MPIVLMDKIEYSGLARKQKQNTEMANYGKLQQEVTNPVDGKQREEMRLEKTNKQGDQVKGGQTSI